MAEKKENHVPELADIAAKGADLQDLLRQRREFESGIETVMKDLERRRAALIEIDKKIVAEEEKMREMSHKRWKF